MQNGIYELSDIRRPRECGIEYTLVIQYTIVIDLIRMTYQLRYFWLYRREIVDPIDGLIGLFQGLFSSFTVHPFV